MISKIKSVSSIGHDLFGILLSCGHSKVEARSSWPKRNEEEECEACEKESSPSAEKPSSWEEIIDAT